MRRNVLTTLMLTAALLPHTLQADDGHHSHDGHGDHGSHGAHVHGVAELLLVRDGGQLELVLESPAANLVGFEHPPASARDHEAIDRAVASLLDSKQLFTIVGDDCVAVDVQLSNPFAEDDQHKQHDHHADAAGHGGSHREFHVSYQYQCTGKTGIKQLKAGLLAVFPAIEQLDVQWITESGQGAGRLSGSNDTVRLQ
ncbi:MAG: DUF2796 domain-containing protein [Proteobacteria bacterium]|nr:DUF2796 domain-containing protein [Pseudomonadota bacterium]